VVVYPLNLMGKIQNGAYWKIISGRRLGSKRHEFNSAFLSIFH